MPLIRSQPSALDKLEQLGESAQFDLSCGNCGAGRQRQPSLDRWIYPAAMPNGKTQKMLKVLLSNICTFDCHYCAQRAERDTERCSFSPDQLAGLFDELVQARKVTGLFLSSGIFGDPVTVMDRMLDTVEIIRKRQGFNGYIHLKLLMGAQPEQIRQALYLADRVSVNFESISDDYVQRIAPRKQLTQGLQATLHQAVDMMNYDPLAYRCKGMSTQLVVGPAGENDRELTLSVGDIYNRFGLSRVYYSAHQPIRDTPLEHAARTPLWREHRLYQADFLMREYDFKADEFVFGEGNSFQRQLDPKLAWVLAHPECFPVEINRAPLHELLRVPGIGPVGAKRIVQLRRQNRFHWPEDLRPLRIRVHQATPFLTFNGKRRFAQGQLDLFAYSNQQADPQCQSSANPTESIGI